MCEAFQLAEQIKDLRQKYVQEKKTLQPCLLVVGADLFTAEAFYTLCDGTLYKYPTFVAALNVCYKIFYVLNVNYPAASKNFWLFVQTIIFELEMENNEKIPSLIQFIHDFNNLN